MLLDISPILVMLLIQGMIVFFDNRDSPLKRFMDWRNRHDVDNR